MTTTPKKADGHQQEIDSLKIERSLLSEAYFQLKEAGKKLEKSESRFRRLADNAQDVIYRMSLPDGKYEYVSPAALSIFGYPPEKFYGTPMLVKQLLHPDWRSYFETEWANLLKGKTPPTYEYQIIDKSGKMHWLNQRNILVRDDAGKPIAIEGIVTDITERKLAEQGLLESEEKFASAFRASPDLMAITRIKDGTILDVNEGYTRMLGYKRDESLGKTTPKLSIWADPADRDKFIAALKKHGEISDFETRLRRKDGTLVTVLDSARTFILKGETCILSTAHDITDRKRAEEIIRKSEVELQEAQRVANMGSWHWDAVADKITWSDQYHRIVGLPIGQAPPNYKNHLKMYSAESAALLDKAVQLATKDGTPYELELNLIHPRGTNKWLLARGEAIRDANGKVIVLQGTIIDITERKMLEEEVRRRNRALTVLSGGNRTLIRAESEEALLKDMCEVLVQKGTYRMAWVGYPMQDKRKTVRIVASAGFDKGFLKKADIVWSDTARGRDLTGTCIRTNKACVSQNLATQPGYKPWREEALQRGYAASIALPLLVGDELIGALTMYAAEPDAFVNEERELLEEFAADFSYGISVLRLRLQHKLTEDLLVRDREEISDLYQHAPCGYHSLDKNGTFIRINDTELKMLGYTREEIVGKKKFGDLVIPEDVAVFNKNFPIFKKQGFFKDAEYEMVRKDGTTFPISVTATSITDKTGKFLASRGVLLDISERKKIERQTHEVDQLKSKFIQIVSHQLRTPLNVIRWNLETLLSRERGQIAPAQEETLRSTYAADIEVISRMNDLLIAMSIEEKQLLLEKDQVDLDELFRSVTDEKIQPCELKRLTCQVHAPKDHLPTVFADGDKIRDVIARLIDNAITYTPEKGNIDVTFGTKDDKIRFEITDSGIGIPTSEQPRIFERFHRGWNASRMKPNASGLGLYISKHYIEAHGGTMGFQSTEKKGSKFWFELPIKG